MQAIPNEAKGKIADEPQVHEAIPKVVLGDHPVVYGSRKALEEHREAVSETAQRTGSMGLTAHLFQTTESQISKDE